MYSFDIQDPEQIINSIKRLSDKALQSDTFCDLARIFHDAVKICSIKLKRKKEKTTKKRKTVTLARKDISKAITILTYFHSNDRYEKILKGSDLAGFYHPNVTEADCTQFMDYYLINKEPIEDKFNNEVIFTDEFRKHLYKDGKGNHTIKSEYFKLERAKRLPLVRNAIKNSTNIYKRIDDDQLEIMYLCRYKDYFDSEFFFVVIVKRHRKSKGKPFVAKTAFPLLRYNHVVRRIEKYEIF